MSKLNKKGFTLVELLAVIIILSIIMLIAIPNVVSILDKNKRQGYVSDTKKLVAQVSTTLRRNTEIPMPVNNTEAVLFYLTDVDNGDFEEDPEGNKYSQTKSFVIVTWKQGEDGDEYNYYVQLLGIEDESDPNSAQRGMILINSNDLKEDSALEKISKETGDFSYTEAEILAKTKSLSGNPITTIIKASDYIEL